MKENFKMSKVKKAIDWALSSLIRLPIFIIFSAIGLAVIGAILYIISPDKIMQIFQYVGITLP